MKLWTNTDKIITIAIMIMLSCGFLQHVNGYHTPTPCETSRYEPFFSGGDGSATNPYKISNVTELQWIGNLTNINKYYVLTNDIDASDTRNWNSGSGFVPIGVNIHNVGFHGHLDGMNHTISGLFINRPGEINIGMIRYLGYSNQGGSVSNLKLTEYNITGGNNVGALVGYLRGGSLTNCHTSGDIYGVSDVGGLVGYNWGSVIDCSTSGNISGIGGSINIGGLVGENNNRVLNSYSTGNVTGIEQVGGLVGSNQNSVNDSYSTGNVNGDYSVGGLVGDTSRPLSNSFYNIDKVLINGGHYVTVGGIFNDQYEDWFNNNMSLNISDYDSTLIFDGSYYNLNSISGFKDLLGFSHDQEYRFGLDSDIDMSAEEGLYIPFFSGKEFDGRGHMIRNISVDQAFGSYLGFFGRVYSVSTIKDLQMMDVEIIGYVGVGGLAGSNSGSILNCSVSGVVIGHFSVGGLVGSSSGSIESSFSSARTIGKMSTGGLLGSNQGKISYCYSTGNVSGIGVVGGLVGYNGRSVSNSYATGNVSGIELIGGLIGNNSNSVLRSYASGSVNGNNQVGGVVGYTSKILTDTFYNIDRVLINGGHYVTVGGIFNDQYEDWFINNMSLNISNYDSTLIFDGSHYNVNSISGLKNLLGFSHDQEYRFGLDSDIDMSGEVGFYIPFFSGKEFDGRGHSISNFTMDQTFVSYLGFFGHIFSMSMINELHMKDIEIIGHDRVGGLAGSNSGSIINCSILGVVVGQNRVGGLVGYIGSSSGSIGRSFSSTQTNGQNHTGGLVGSNQAGKIYNSYSTGNVTGNGTRIGGFLGFNYRGRVINCYSTGRVFVPDIIEQNNKGFAGDVDDRSGYEMTGNFWDMETSQQLGTAGNASGKTTQEMRTTSTFTSAGWDFIEIWCMIEGATYPLLRWQDRETPRAFAGPDRIVYMDDDGKAEVILDGSGSWDDVGITHSWSFDYDGGSITLYGERTEFVFKILGTYEVTLQVTDALNRGDTHTINITVVDLIPPVANAGPDQVVNEGALVLFDGSSSSDNVVISNFNWTFFDEEHIHVRGIRPSRIFSNPGIYIVTLNVSDNSGNWNTDTMKLTVYDTTLPIANAGNDSIVDAGSGFTFDGSGSYDNVAIVNYTWTFLDGEIIVLYGMDPSYRFDNLGIFEVTLTVTDGEGHWSADKVRITVLDRTHPVAHAGLDQIVDEGDLIIFDGRGSIDNVGIANWTWTFIDGGPIFLYGVRPEYRFDNWGIYVVTLNVSDASGNWAISSMTVTVNDITPPIADAGSYQRVAVGSTVILNGSLSTDNGIISIYTWTFTYLGEMKVLEGEAVVFTFEVGGVIEATLTVVDQHGNSGDDKVTITVVDTGIVKGTIKDNSGKVVEGALVEILASNGNKYSTKTGPDGSFSLEIFHGAFNWEISKSGYVPISGTSSVDPMGEIELDLSDTPLPKEGGSLTWIVLIPISLLLMLLILGGILLIAWRRKERDPDDGE